MKRALVVAGLIVFILAGAIAGYVAWFVRRAVLDRTEVRASLRSVQASAIDVDVDVRGTQDPIAITEISMERSLQGALGISPPGGFKVEALPLEDREKGDPAAIAFVEKFNRESVRFVGSLVVKPGHTGLLKFPAEHPTAANGQMRLRYEKKLGLGGSTGFVSVNLGSPTGP